MIHLWFRRNLNVHDGLLTARDVLNQELFCRAAEETGCAWYSQMMDETIAVEISGHYTPKKLARLFTALDAVGLAGLMVEYETPGDREAIAAADPEARFLHARAGVVRQFRPSLQSRSA